MATDPYTWTDRDGGTLHVYQHTKRVQIVEDGWAATVAAPPDDEAVLLARAVLAAAGSDARVVEGGDPAEIDDVDPDDR